MPDRHVLDRRLVRVAGGRGLSPDRTIRGPLFGVGPVGSTPATKVSMPDALLDVDGQAAKFGVTVGFVRRLVEERRVPYLKIGRLVRFDPIEVEQWISASRVASHYGPESVGRRRSHSPRCTAARRPPRDVRLHT